MLTGQLIWGDNFLKELSEPHPDPKIRAFEEKMHEYSMMMLRKHFGPRTYDNSRWLPTHYRVVE